METHKSNILQTYYDEAIPIDILLRRVLWPQIIHLVNSLQEKGVTTTTTPVAAPLQSTTTLHVPAFIKRTQAAAKR